MIDNFFAMTRTIPSFADIVVDSWFETSRTDSVPQSNFIREERNTTYNTTINFGSKPAHKKNFKKDPKDIFVRNHKDLETKISQYVQAKRKKGFFYDYTKKYSDCKYKVVLRNRYGQTDERFFHITVI